MFAGRRLSRFDQSWSALILQGRERDETEKGRGERGGERERERGGEREGERERERGGEREGERERERGGERERE